MGRTLTTRQKLFNAFMALHMKRALREWLALCREKGVCWVCRRGKCPGATGATFEAHWSQVAPKPGVREFVTLAIVKGRK